MPVYMCMLIFESTYPAILFIITASVYAECVTYLALICNLLGERACVMFAYTCILMYILVCTHACFSTEIF